MILILSYHSYEQCTDPVIDWLLYYKANFIKITFEDIYKGDKVKFDVNSNKVYFNDIDLVQEIGSIYLRRFETDLDLNLKNCFPTSQAITELRYEMEDLTRYFFYLLRDKVWLPDSLNINIDKLTTLSIAKQCGLKIPETIITNSKKYAFDFVSKIHSIVKPIHFSGYYVDKEQTYSVYTNSISLMEVSKINNNHFFPTLFQEKIDKEFEVRAFFLDGEIYATAIITDEETYDDVKRTFGSDTINWIPFQFPEKICSQIINFMKRLNLNTGSIDMMKDKNGEFVFIEINPVGQFLAPSRRCNYNLEQKIAKWLFEHDKR